MIGAEPKGHSWIFIVLLTAFSLYILRYDHKQEETSEITVIIPCYNCEQWLDETLESLALQTFQNFTTILVDDGSTKKVYRKGLEILRHYRNFGLSAARNTGVLATRSPYIIFLDPDDLIEPDCLEKLYIRLRFQDSSQVAFAYPGVVHFHNNAGRKEVLGRERSPFNPHRLTKENYIPSFALINRQVYLAAGGMCEGIIKYWEDYDFWLRLLNLDFEGVLLDEELFWYRRHDHGRSSYINKNIKKAEWLKELQLNNPASYGGNDGRTVLELEDGEYEKTPPCYYAMDKSRFSLLSRLNPVMAFAYVFYKTFILKRSPSKEAVKAHAPFKTLPDNAKDIKQTQRLLMIIPWMQVHFIKRPVTQ